MQIIFYEERNFQGSYYECRNDCSNLSFYISRCNSLRVLSGCWMMYELPDFQGYQYFIQKGDYPNFRRWMGYNSSIRSCLAIPQYSGSYRLRLYERNNFGGKIMEATEDCPSVYDQFHHQDIQSCNVFEGYWIFYEQPNYRGHQYYIRPGEYRRFTDWGSQSSRVGSFRQIIQLV